MDRTLTEIVLLLASSIVSGQQNHIRPYLQRLDNLKNVVDLPYICRSAIGDPGCGDSLFWNIVAGRIEIVPFLIEKLDDSTQTTAIVPNIGGFYTVADVAFSAICEIIDGLFFSTLVRDYGDVGQGDGSWGYWNYARQKHENRIKFKKSVAQWFDDNKKKLVWKESALVLTGDCSFPHPNGGHFVVKE